MKRMDQLTGQYKIYPNPNPNTKYVLIDYVIYAGLFFSLDPICIGIMVMVRDRFFLISRRPCTCAWSLIVYSVSIDLPM